MLRLEDLKTITSTPQENEISLQLYAEFYRAFISCRLYDIELEDKSTLMFKAQNCNFPHLIALKKFIDYKNTNIHLRKMFELEGDPGFKNLHRGRITLDDLKTVVHGKNKVYKGYKQRILNFPFAYQLIRNSTFMKYDKSLINSTRIEGNYMFIDDIDNKKMHLIFVDNNMNQSVPITFLTTKIDDDTFTKDQELLKISKITIKDIGNPNLVLEVIEPSSVSQQVGSSKEEVASSLTTNEVKNETSTKETFT